jgi:hypothetical protein
VAAFTAAGRPASDVIRTFNSILDYGAFAAIFQYAQAHKIPVDEIMYAHYLQTTYNNYGPEYNFLTIDMVMDVAELSIPGSHAYNLGIATSWVNSLSPGTKVSFYEAGPNNLFVGGDDAHRVAQSQSAAFHPRMYALMLNDLQECQDHGCSMYAKASFAGPLQNDVYPDGAGIYAAYLGCGMLPGIGDGSDGKPDNRPALAAVVPGSKGPNYASMCSPEGAAINRWNALVTSGPTKALKKPSPTRVGGPVSHPGGQGRRAR